MDASRRAALLVCLGVFDLLTGCADEKAGWAYNTCGDPYAIEVSSSDVGWNTANPPVDVNSLLDEMTALGGLARRARSPFCTCMVSSYDRSSTAPQAFSDTPAGWFANHDWGNDLGEEDGPRSPRQFVLLDADGPGAIVRIWSGTPSGTLRIYIDRATRPVVESPMADLLGGRVSPFFPPFAGTTAKGGNLEFPLPFRGHVKVTWEGSVGFYQITYRKYVAPLPNITSFHLSELDADKLVAVRTKMQPPALQDSSVVNEQAVLSASAPELAIGASPGGEEIVSLRIHPNQVDSTSLRGSVLSLRFDGQETVRTPLGDFFGAGPGLLPHATLLLESTAAGELSARFVMPFAQTAILRIDATPGLEAAVTISHQPALFDRNTYYFHAHWTARGPGSTRPYRDILFADLVGEGAYVGTSLAVGNSSSAWWGEGDEKVWIDDDSFPSLFGTGTEDYFGQAYCSPVPYNHPYRAQSLAAGGFGEARGLFSLLRAHVLDPIRFRRNLKFNLELWHWDEGAEVTFDSVTYFYLAPNGVDNLPLPENTDFRLSPFGP